FARGVKGPRQIVDEGIERRLACTSPQNLKRNGIGLKDTFRRRQHPTALRLAVREPHAARQPRLGTRRYRELFCQIVPCRSLPYTITDDGVPLWRVSEMAIARPARTRRAV